MQSAGPRTVCSGLQILFNRDMDGLGIDVLHTAFAFEAVIRPALNVNHFVDFAWSFVSASISLATGECKENHAHINKRCFQCAQACVCHS